MQNVKTVVTVERERERERATLLNKVAHINVAILKIYILEIKTHVMVLD